MTEPTEPTPLRTILALIALATDLPVPTSYNVYGEGKISLRLMSVADGVAWAAYLGTPVEPYVGDNGTRSYLGAGPSSYWHGWRIQLQASELTGLRGALDEDTAAALAAVADQRESVTKK